jgi:polyisoprenoid-binding protein YceI
MSWELDTAHTQIEVSVKHMMVTTVKGHFKKFSGTVEIDEQTPEVSAVDVTIETSSIDTGQDQRDAHLRSPDFLDADQFPTATYKSKSVELLGKDRARILGDLTIRGVTREVPLEVTFEGETKNMYGRRLAAFTAQGTFNRKDFGLEWNVALETGGWLVSDQVKINIEAQALQVVPTAEAATSAAGSQS